MLLQILFFFLLWLQGATTQQQRYPGLESAVRLIKGPVPNNGHVKGVILTGIVNEWEANAYKLQILRQRIGYAWELVITDFGYERPSTGVDLINRRRRIAIELKNSCRISSSAKRNAYRVLRDFKRRHPAYRVILACINYRNLNRGGSTLHRGVHYMKGRSFLTYILQSRKTAIIQRLKTAARAFVRQQ